MHPPKFDAVASWFPWDISMSALPLWATFGGNVPPRPFRLLSSRTIMSSQKQLVAVRTGRKLTRETASAPIYGSTDAKASRRFPPSLHQNSSASLFITQSAPNLDAASLAIRVTQADWL